VPDFGERAPDLDTAASGAGEPAIEQVPVRDALRVAQLADEVVVVDGHPRYHLADCPTLRDADTIPLAVSAARRGGFTPCAACGPDASLLARSRGRSGERTGERAEERPDGRTAERPNGDSQQL
jgi:hypothetical protein